MDVVVCVKQIPDPADPGELDAETRTLRRDVKLILDESDSYGVEMALQLVDSAGEGEVRLVSMVPNSEMSGLRTALAMGAASAVLVSDEALAGSDALSTAKVLAAAIRRSEPDLILTATESSDGYTGTVPVQVAELLGLPSVTFGREVTVADGVATVKRQTEAGYDVVECPLPAVVSVTAGVVEPRYPSFKGIMAAKNKPVDELDLAGLGIDPTTVGWSGARQEIVEVVDAAARESGEVVVDEGDATSASWLSWTSSRSFRRRRWDSRRSGSMARPPRSAQPPSPWSYWPRLGNWPTWWRWSWRVTPTR